MAHSVNNNVFELSLTPSRKRKRNLDGLHENSKDLCKNKKDILQIFKMNKANKENTSFINSACLEEKSIAEIVSQKQNSNENVYEVIRKPPKKKKKIDIEKSCFINPALNLNVPENKFNPFEVKRPSPVASKTHCFVNQGLNIRTDDNNINFNPFEISRQQTVNENDPKMGIANPALESPKALMIALPFTPTIGCRIDFSKIQFENLTPSKLLQEKLVFSPDINTNDKNSETNKTRRSLSVISEEVDIGNELDCYQLELENSINEAKFKKSGIKLKRSFEMNLPEIKENSVTNTIKFEENSSKQNERSELKENPESKDEEFEYYDDEEETNDFKLPAPFVRSYQKTIEPKKINNSNENIKVEKKTIQNTIRKSIRNIIHSVSKTEDKTEKTNKDENTDNEQRNKMNSNIFNTVRRSLRIGKSKQKSENTEQLNDISIIDNSTRQIFRSNSIEDGISVTGNFSKKSSFRNSLRRSSRNLKNQFYKTMMKSTENYDLK